MTERALYKCDICGTEYARIDDAYACEAYHYRPKRIERLRYKPRGMGEVARFPLEVVVEFENGEKRAYRR